MQFLDKHGWPVEYARGRPIQKWLRRLIHTRRIKRGTVWTDKNLHRWQPPPVSSENEHDY